MEEKSKFELEFTHPALVRNIFLSPQKYTNEKVILEKAKILSQTYESIYNLFEAKKSQFETYFPSFQEIYEDLEFRKKNISDKIPMPTHEELLKILFILATYQPPMIFIVRELKFSGYGQIEFDTKITFPFNDQLELIQKGIQHVIHNSMVTFRNHLNEIKALIKIKENIIISELSDLDEILEKYQLEGLLKKIYFHKNQFEILKEDDDKRINAINQLIKKYRFIPFLQELMHNRFIVNFKRKFDDLVLPDIFLINDLFQIELRFNLMLDLIFQEKIKENIMKFLSDEEKSYFQSKNRIEQAIFFSQKIIQNKDSLPRSFMAIALELLSLKEYIDKQINSPN